MFKRSALLLAVSTLSCSKADTTTDTGVRETPNRWSGEVGLTSATATLLGSGYHEDAGEALAFYPGPISQSDAGLIVGAPGAGGAFVVAIDTRGAVPLDEAGTFLAGEETWAGTSVDNAGDVNADGYEDVIISDTEAGAAFVFYGPISGAERAPDAALRGAGGLYGPSAVSSAGDVNGDGVADMWIGSPHTCVDDTIGCSGAAWLFLGPVTGTEDIATAYQARLTTAPGARTGQSIAGVGDCDGDGVSDVVIGVPNDGSKGAPPAAAFVVHGPVEGAMDLTTSAGGVVDDGGLFELGAAVAGAGDVDGDGLTDVLVGAPGASGEATRSGAVIVLRGPAETRIDASDAMAVMWGDAEGDEAGAALAGGDVDGDGLGDILVGIPGRDRDAGGGVLIYGPVESTVELGAAGSASFIAERTGDSAGASVALGPATGGHGPVAIGAPRDDTRDTRSGAAFLLQFE